ncbi:MAG: flippase [Thermoleophilia bacterium]
MSPDQSQQPEQKENSHALTRGRLLARNTVWHLFGQVIPLIAALISIPILIRSLGAEKFGVLTLAWLLIGYFSFFDFGLGRTLTKLIADKLGEGREDELPALIWTGVGLLLIPGLLGAAAITFLAPLVVSSILHISGELYQETMRAFYLCAFAIPILVGTEALMGVLMARQRHDLVNAVEIPVGILMYIGPAAALPFSHNLAVLIATLVAVRILALLCHIFFCFKVYDGLWRNRQFKRDNLRPLVRFGSWMTVSNITGPLLAKVDRFMIGAFISVTAVAYYATPYQVVTQLWVVPTAMVMVLFPAFAMSFAQDRDRMAYLFERGTKYVLLLIQITQEAVNWA